MHPVTRSRLKRAQDPEDLNRADAEPKRKRQRGLSKNLTCNICNHKFTKISHLNNHAAVHDGNRQKFFCPYPNCRNNYFEIKNWRHHFKKSHSHGPNSLRKKQLDGYEEKIIQVGRNHWLKYLRIAHKHLARCSFIF